jgi:hypothetical protein
MTDALFWDIVGLLDWSKWSKRTDKKLAILEPAIAKLSELSIREIFLFEEFLRWRVYTLDTREHARHSGSGKPCDTHTGPDQPFSTDGFLDRRSMAVAKGRAEYESVLADPTRMPKEKFELFLYLARYAYERKTGEYYEYRAGVSTKAGSNSAGWLAE